jgi:hypothetical protein
MSFDGLKYKSAAYTLPTYYHPGAPFQSQAVANCLQNSYFAGQQNARLVLQAVFPSPVGLPYANQEDLVVHNGSDVLIAEGYAFLPENITHLCAAINYGAISMDGGKIDHKLKITNASAATLSTTQTDVIPSLGASRPPANTYSALGWPPGLATHSSGAARAQPTATSSVNIELEKSGTPSIALGQVCTIEVYGHAYFIRPGSGTRDAEFYRPHFISVWTETRAEQ